MTARRLTVVLISLLVLPPAATSQVPEECTRFDDVAIIGTNSVHLKQGVRVEGDVVANEKSEGPVLERGVELSVDRRAEIDGSARADSIDLSRGATITGTVDCNDGSGVVCDGLTLPVFDELPTFQSVSIRPGADDVFVAAGEVKALAAGEYGDVTIAQGGTLVLDGDYALRSVAPVSTAGGQCSYPCRAIVLAGASEVRVERRFDLGKNACISPGSTQAHCPARGLPIAASGAQGVFYVGGPSGGAGGPGDLPAAATVGRDSVVAANFYAVGGTFLLDRGSRMKGAAIARDVRIDRDSVVSEDTYFFNRPPIADDQSVNTNGDSSIVVTLTGTDPDGGDLMFTIAGEPSKGTLGEVSPNEASAVSRCSISGGACSVGTDCPLFPDESCESVVPPIDSADVTYEPASPALEEEDSFTFEVKDECGLTAIGTVTINPFDPSPPDPGPTVIDVEDVSVDTTPETQVGIGLTASGPESATLAITVESAPSGGSLEDSGGNPITASNVPYTLPAADTQVFYTPDAGTTSDSFLYAAGDGQIPDPDDTATVTISVGDRFPLAPDQQVVTGVDSPVQITLFANPGGAGDSGGQAPLAAAVQQTSFGGASSRGPVSMQAGPPVSIDAGVAWNVADANGDGFGDESNAGLPGFPGTPNLISAAVDSVGGAGTNGTVRIHIEFDIRELAGINVEAATVELATSLGTTDSLDTFFFTGNASGNGTLENSDFETASTELDGVVMPVSSAGSFSFDVATRLQAAIDAQFSHLVIQGRVDEELSGPARGLQVVSACATCATVDPPTLVVTPGGQPNLEVTDFAAPASALLDDEIGGQITTVISNTGDAAIPAGSSATIGYYISVDSEISNEDRLLAGGFENLSQQAPDGLAPGESFTVDFLEPVSISSTFPDANPITGDNVFIGVLVDVFGDIDESDETDNTAALPITVEGTPPPELTWTIKSLPAVSLGKLSFQGSAVTVGQTFTTQPTVLFTPVSGVSGATDFTYEVRQGTLSGLATVGVVITSVGSCLSSEALCDDGRNGGSGIQAPEQLPPGSPGLELEAEGPGSVAAAPLGVGHGLPTVSCSRGVCTAHFPAGATVVVGARPEGARSEFVSWQGDCGGTNPLALVTMGGDRRCVAVFRTVDR